MYISLFVPVLLSARLCSFAVSLSVCLYMRACMCVCLSICMSVYPCVALVSSGVVPLVLFVCELA